MLLLLNSFFIFFISNADGKSDCEKKDIFYLETQLQRKESDIFCFKNNPNMFTSQNCTSECSILKLVKESNLKLEDVFKERGSPDFNLCHAIGCSPQTFKFKKNEKSFTRCISPDGGAFVDLSTLFIAFKKSRK